MKTRRWIVVTALLASGVGGARAELINGIKAIVHDSVVTYDEVNVSAARAADLLRRQYRDDPDGFRKKLNEVFSDNLEKLVERQLILRDFVQAGYNLPESFVDEAFQTDVRENYGGDRATFTKSLQAKGVTIEKYRQQLRDDMISTILRSKNVSQVVVISPHKIEKYYLDNRDKYKVEDEVKLRMIVLNKSGGADAAAARKLAEEILAKIKEGASFAEMASVYSQGSQRSQGGDWDWVPKLDRDGAPVLRKELADVAFSLKPGEVSHVIELPDVLYLMKVEETRPAHTRPLSEIRDEIERTLRIQEQARMQKRYIDKLRAKTFVRYF